eukprot:6483580-Amphidinium_carterae.1
MTCQAAHCRPNLPKLAAQGSEVDLQQGRAKSVHIDEPSSCVCASLLVSRLKHFSESMGVSLKHRDCCNTAALCTCTTSMLEYRMSNRVSSIT